MKKELYITPETEAVAVNDADIITTSPVEVVSDELKGIDESFFPNEDGLFELF